MGAQVKLSPKLKRLNHDEQENGYEEKDEIEEHNVSLLKGMAIFCVLGGILWGLTQSHRSPISLLTFSMPHSYVVQKGDNLWNIVKDHYPREDLKSKMREIRDLNHLKGDRVQIGQHLKMP